LVHALERALQGDIEVPEEVLYALDIYSDLFQKEVLEAFFLAGATNSEVAEILEIPERISDVYRHLFFDMGVFRNRLDIISYAAHYEGDDNGYGKTLKDDAVHEGLEILKVTFQPGYRINPVDAVHETISQAYALSKAAKKHPIDSPKAREARQWNSVLLSSINAAQNAMNLGTDDNHDLLIKLELMNYDHEAAKATDAELPDVPLEDIVHRSQEDK